MEDDGMVPDPRTLVVARNFGSIVWTLASIMVASILTVAFVLVVTWSGMTEEVKNFSVTVGVAGCTLVVFGVLVVIHRIWVNTDTMGELFKAKLARIDEIQTNYRVTLRALGERAVKDVIYQFQSELEVLEQERRELVESDSEASQDIYTLKELDGRIDVKKERLAKLLFVAKELRVRCPSPPGFPPGMELTLSERAGERSNDSRSSEGRGSKEQAEGVATQTINSPGAPKPPGWAAELAKKGLKKPDEGTPDEA